MTITKTRPLVDAGCTASEAMTSPAVACRDSAFFEEVADVLAERDISGMPVVDSAGDVVGVVSERDLAYALGGPLVRRSLRRHHGRPISPASDLPREGRRAKDIMTTPVLAVAPDTAIEEVARVMQAHQVNRVPVIDDGRLVGIVTRGDVLGAVAHLAHRPCDTGLPVVVVGSSGMNPGGRTCNR